MKIILTAASAALLALTACGGADNKAAENKAENIVEAGENKAEAYENQADAAENKADAVREEAANEAEAVEDAAENTN